MIEKPHGKPRYLKKLEALLRRTPSDHPSYPFIKEQLSKSASGYKGEQNLSFFLSFLPEKEYHIFHDLRLLDKERYFQLDILILSSSFCLILEVKNIAGTLYFDPHFHQLVRTFEGREEAFPDPIIQITRQKRQLEEWFQSKKIAVPIEALVVIANSSSVIRTTTENQHLSQTILRRDFLPQKITELEHTYPKNS
ncbi:nuclease-related domain-containing protein [Bacillus solitudinis]|uniref:nuclease-related domain-containing protein n=1 Tax=Bacillus solitudinis TaxID=2014074 RepID=UPI0012FDC79C|nr:nuclease-related domain-containing protein [Bacillus solitudinis]